MNPIKAVRLAWHMRKVKGRLKYGEPHLISEAFLRAGIIKNSELVEMTEQIVNDRIAHAFLDYADALKREAK